MALYELSDQQVINIKKIMSQATIKGTDVPAFIDSMNALQPIKKEENKG